MDQSISTQITFREGLTQADRELAEQSVATLVSQAMAKAEKAHAAAADRARVTAALNAPFQKLFEQDADAVKAIDNLRNGHLIEEGAVNFSEEPVQGEDGNVSMSFQRDIVSPVLTTIANRSINVRVPPYDFSWSWFVPPHAPASMLLDNATGRVGLSCLSGSTPGGASGRVEAHAGFGLILSTDHHHVTAIGRSYRTMHFGYAANAIGIGSNATAEGGMEFTALEDGRFLLGKSSRLWHRRVSSDDDNESYQEGPHPIYEPNELYFSMGPGHGYTFNVGIWVVADRTPGFGIAGAHSLEDGWISAITIER